MTYDELLAKIDKEIAMWGNNEKAYMENALRAVVELHKPVKDEWIDYVTCAACRVPMDDYYSVTYPCPTIQAIQKELQC